MAKQFTERTVEVSHAGTFAAELADRLQDLLDEQDTWAVQTVTASTDGASVEREIMDWGAVLSAAKEALLEAARDENDDEVTDIPTDPDRVSVRSVDLSVGAMGTVTIGVA
jgi:hypothetical protein